MKNSTQHFILQPSRFRLDGGAMFGIIPRPMWMKVAPPDDANRIELALRLWLIKSADRVVLIDTGIGDYHDQKFNQRFDVQGPGAPLDRALEQVGLARKDVTDLVLSHLHFDHAGGLATRREDGSFGPTFAHARLHLHRQHHAYALKPTMKDGGSFHASIFQPVIEQLDRAQQVVWHDGAEGVLIPELGLKFKTSHGHTPYLMHPYNDRFIYLADLVPTAHHIHLPWVMAYDMQPGLSASEKHTLFEFVSENNLTIIFEHDPVSWGANLALKDGHFSAKEAFPARGREGSSYSVT